MKEKLKEILAIQTYTGRQWRMFAYLIRKLKGMECELFTYNGCIYVTKGNSELYPCVVAHMDSVHPIVKNKTILEIGDNLIAYNFHKMKQTGIAGDDIVGVFIALQCLEMFDNIKIVFFRDEESGCEGSMNTHDEFFDDVSFILQCDRQKYGDFITDIGNTQLSSKEFQDDVFPIIKKYGYSFTDGMMTDVMQLKENHILPSMANISCGYYNPHTNEEYVNVPQVGKCLLMVKDIIYSLGSNSYPCEYKRPSYKKYGKPIPFSMHSEYEEDDWWEELGEYNKKYIDHDVRGKCDCCLDTVKSSYNYKLNEYLCKKCEEEYAELIEY